MAFSKEDLLASLSLGSTEPAAITIGTEMSLADLELQCQQLSSAASGPTRAGRKVRTPMQESSEGKPGQR